MPIDVYKRQALDNVDVYCGLVVCCGREDLALLGRDGSISFNQSGCYAAHGLDGKRQRGNVQKQHIACTCIELCIRDRAPTGSTN